MDLASAVRTIELDNDRLRDEVEELTSQLNDSNYCNDLLKTDIDDLRDQIKVLSESRSILENDYDNHCSNMEDLLEQLDQSNEELDKQIEAYEVLEHKYNRIIKSLFDNERSPHARMRRYEEMYEEVESEKVVLLNIIKKLVTHNGS